MIDIFHGISVEITDVIEIIDISEIMEMADIIDITGIIKITMKNLNEKQGCQSHPGQRVATHPWWVPVRSSTSPSSESKRELPYDLRSN